MQFDVLTRNARLDAIEASIGVSPILKIRSGAKPTNMTDASTGTVLATIQLPADWMSAASAGSKAKLGTWEDAGADATGIAGYYEIVRTDNSVAERGTVTMTGGGGDMEVQNTNFAVGQNIIITTKTYVDGNA